MSDVVEIITRYGLLNIELANGIGITLISVGNVNEQRKQDVIFYLNAFVYRYVGYLVD